MLPLFFGVYNHPLPVSFNRAFFLLFLFRFDIVRYSAALSSFSAAFLPHSSTFFVLDSGRVDIDRKPILHGYITRTGDMGPNQYGSVTADWLKQW